MDAFVKRLPKIQNADEDTYSHCDCDTSGGRPPKRAKVEEIADSESDDSVESSERHGENSLVRNVDQVDDEQQHRNETRPTDFENALPPTQTDENAIEEYEAFKSSQKSAQNDDGTSAKTRPLWIKGRSSIYVDAFNLALDTVLQEESQLFDSKELYIFKQWAGLDYEAQYLYVRLFLRKTAAWHRSSRLGYYADVSDPDVAIATLQDLRELPFDDTTSEQSPLEGIDLEQFVLTETFTFADASEDHITTIEDAASLLYLDELKALAKDAKIQGKNKAELVKGICRVGQQQTSLMALGLSRQNSRDSEGSESSSGKLKDNIKIRRESSNHEQHLLGKILDILGPCIRLSPPTFKLFERVHLVFYRSTEWSEKSLTTIILAKIARRNFPDYIVCRTSTIFASRLHLLEFEAAIRLEAEVDVILEFNGPPTEEGYQKVVDLFEKVYPRWKTMVAEEEVKERTVYEMGEGAYLRRFNPAHSYTRIILKGIYVLGRRKEHAREHRLFTELLDQRLFHTARRGSWYQRKALLEEHYMPKVDETPASSNLELQKKHWNRIAVSTCEAGLQDPNCHLIFHYDLQKRLVKLEKKIRIPRRLQHDFGHVRLVEAKETFVEGVQLKRDVSPKPGAQAASTQTIWLDELGSGGECSVEEMCLSHFRSEGWKGYHAEGGIIRTLFAYLFYDILFLYIPNVFQTAYQMCPLDLHTDAFYPARASEINHRLVEISNGDGEKLLRSVWEREHEKRTSVIGLNWDFDVDDLAELVGCFEGSALAAICKVMSQEYRVRGGGIPDLVLWRTNSEDDQSIGSGTGLGERPGIKTRGEVLFAEVKSANDRLSDTQRLWIHVLTGAGVEVTLCNAVAREVREVG